MARAKSLEDRADIKDRFDEKWREDDQGCWVWEGARDSKGYGSIKIDGSAKIASRISYRLHVGAIPEDKLVLHTCDNKECVNPEHLYRGTYADNMEDAIERGEFHKKTGRGEEKDVAKLSADDVREIREKYENTNATQKDLAESYEVTQSHISRIVRREWWKHV